MYGKLVNGLLKVAPKTYIKDGKTICNFNKSVELMLQEGFKPVVNNKPVYDPIKYDCYLSGYKEYEDYIETIYELVEIELTPEQATEVALAFLNIDLEKEVQTLSDEEALEVKVLYPEWLENVKYSVGYKVRYANVLYKVLTEHTSQSTWTPDVSPSLFAKVIVGEGGEILDWVQPDSTNPYMKGDKVRFEGKVYVSVIDNNVWSPSAYPQGWEEIVNE